MQNTIPHTKLHIISSILNINQNLQIIQKSIFLNHRNKVLPK